MCGIFGAIKLSGRYGSADYERFVASTNMVIYRGPDSYGFYSVDSSTGVAGNSVFNVFLGHRRLSIIDLSEDGRQPMEIDDCTIIYNGEIFNYIELKEELRSEGIQFKTQTDTEVIIKIYRKYGSMGFSRLNGMWAFIILDRRTSKVIVSRDRFSIKPLFYYNSGKDVFFASEIKQILPFLEKKIINQDVFYKYLQQTLLDYDDQTFFDGIRKVKPKSNIIIELTTGKISEESYWDYELVPVDSKDPFQQFRELFIDSVRIRLRSDVNIGALLSGGLDSSAISVIADNLTGNKLRTFSIISAEKNFTEEKYIDILSREKKITNQKLTFTNDSVLSNLDNVIYHQDEPFGGFSVIAQYNIFELIKKHTDIVVVLSGQGGDELLMGYLKFYFFYLKDLFRTGKYLQTFQEFFGSLISRTVLWQFKLNMAKRYIPSYMNHTSNYIKVSGILENIWDTSDIKRRQITDIDKYSVPVLAHFEDRNSTAHSLESRLPFLDHRLVNFVLSLNTELKIKNGWTKYVLRKSIKELPDRIRWRRDKQGFVVPEDKWLRIDLREEINRTFKNSVLDELGIIDQKKFLEYYESFLNGNRTIYCNDIAKVYIAEKWAVRYLN